MRLLVTRPQADGERTAVSLRARGHVVMLAPLLRIEAVAFELPAAEAGYGGVVVTSANAVHAIAAPARRLGLTALPAFAVGARTADAARAAGFGVVHSAQGDRNDLVALIRAHRSPADLPLLYLAGEDRAGNLTDLVADHIRVVTVVAYRAVKAEFFPAEAVTALAQGRIDGVLHFSKRSAQAYLDCAARAQMLADALRPLHFCLSRQVSEPLAAAGAATIRIAPHPDEAALFGIVDAG